MTSGLTRQGLCHIPSASVQMHTDLPAAADLEHARVLVTVLEAGREVAGVGAVEIIAMNEV